MGRLTLNVLLSFAQFEREVTGERIRDKFAASKKKGMWMGGLVPLGYDLGKRELVVNETEADQVREIFKQYLRLGSVFELEEYLKGTDFRSKRQVSAKGRQHGGHVLSRGTLYHLLRNPLYLGKVRHKGTIHQGQHRAIVSEELWNAVAEQLKHGSVVRRQPKNLPSQRMLTGRLFHASGAHYQPTHASKSSRRYFYYACRRKDGKCTRLPALQIEALVVSRLKDLLGDSLALADLCPGLPIPEMRQIVTAGRHQADQLSRAEDSETRAFVRSIVQRVIFSETNAKLEIATKSLLHLLLGSMESERNIQSGTLKLDCALEVRRRGGEVRLILSAGERTEPAPSLVRSIAQARDWVKRIVAGEISSIEELVKYSGLNNQYCNRILRLASLSPRIVDEIVAGRHPADLSILRLAINLPLCWDKQTEHFQQL